MKRLQRSLPQSKTKQPCPSDLAVQGSKSGPQLPASGERLHTQPLQNKCVKYCTQHAMLHTFVLQKLLTIVAWLRDLSTIYYLHENKYRSKLWSRPHAFCWYFCLPERAHFWHFNCFNILSHSLGYWHYNPTGSGADVPPAVGSDAAPTGS